MSFTITSPVDFLIWAVTVNFSFIEVAPGFSSATFNSVGFISPSLSTKNSTGIPLITLLFLSFATAVIMTTFVPSAKILLAFAETLILLIKSGFIPSVPTPCPVFLTILIKTN